MRGWEQSVVAEGLRRTYRVLKRSMDYRFAFRSRTTLMQPFVSCWNIS